MDTQRIHQEQLIEYVLQFPHGRIANLVKKETTTIGPPDRCVKHGITLPVHVKMFITPGNMFQPSYLTEIQI